MKEQTPTRGIIGNLSRGSSRAKQQRSAVRPTNLWMVNGAIPCFWKSVTAPAHFPGIHCPVSRWDKPPSDAGTPMVITSDGYLTRPTAKLRWILEPSPYAGSRPPRAEGLRCSSVPVMDDQQLLANWVRKQQTCGALAVAL